MALKYAHANITNRMAGLIVAKTGLAINIKPSSQDKFLPRVTLSEVASLFSQKPTQERTTIRAQGRYT